MNKLTVTVKGKIHLLQTGQTVVLDALIGKLQSMLNKKVKVGAITFKRDADRNITLIMHTSDYMITYTGATSDKLEELINKY
jgi:hypothetical protein